MANYAVEFTPRAKRELEKLPKLIQQRLRPRIDALAENPRPSGVKALAGVANVGESASEITEWSTRSEMRFCWSWFCESATGATSTTTSNPIDFLFWLLNFSSIGHEGRLPQRD
jgi:hypothetical protein